MEEEVGPSTEVQALSITTEPPPKTYGSGTISPIFRWGPDTEEGLLIWGRVQISPTIVDSESCLPSAKLDHGNWTQAGSSRWPQEVGEASMVRGIRLAALSSQGTACQALFLSAETVAAFWDSSRTAYLRSSSTWKQLHKWKGNHPPKH